MCILCILAKTDKEKRTFLGEDASNADEEDCYSMGMELLQAASQSSPLSARYVAILQQLQGDSVVSTGVSKETSVPAQDTSVSQAYPSQVPADSQYGSTRWDFSSQDPMSGFDFDFADIDNLFFSTGPLWQSSMGAAENQMSAAYMSW